MKTFATFLLPLFMKIQSQEVEIDMSVQSWNQTQAPLEITWFPNDISIDYKVANITLFNTKDSGINLTFDNIQTEECESTFTFPKLLLPNLENYRVNVTVFIPSNPQIYTGTSQAFNVTNGLNYDQLTDCASATINSQGGATDQSGSQAYNFNWNINNRMAIPPKFDFILKNSNGLTYSQLNKTANGSSGNVTLVPSKKFESGDRYHAIAVFSNADASGAQLPVCKITSDEFSL